MADPRAGLLRYAPEPIVDLAARLSRRHSVDILAFPPEFGSRETSAPFQLVLLVSLQNLRFSKHNVTIEVDFLPIFDIGQAAGTGNTPDLRGVREEICVNVHLYEAGVPRIS